MKKYPDVVSSDVCPAEHYLLVGAGQGRDPHRLFDTDWYVSRYLSAPPQEYNPLLHFLKVGAARGFDPHPLFDSRWYLHKYPDVAASGVNPWIHYLSEGGKELRDPHPLFDAKWYVSRNPSGGASSSNPLFHYLEFGTSLRLDPHPLFSVDWYLSSYPEVIDSGLNPLIDFIVNGVSKNRQPNALFNPLWYIETNHLSLAADMNPLVHYANEGEARGLRTHPLFDREWCRSRSLDVNDDASLLAHVLLRSEDPNVLFDGAWYATTNPDLAVAGVNPLWHYLRQGWKEGRDPHPLFDVRRYLAINKDVADAGIEPLSHYLSSGWQEGRSAHVLFDANWYLIENPDVAEAKQSPLAHFLKFGAREGRNPNAFFDMSWYKRQNEDVVGDENPLVHYALKGGKEGLDPGPLFDAEYYLASNIDVLEDGLDPLAHFLSWGAAEGRQPRPPDRDVMSCHVMDIPYEIRRVPGPLANRDVCLFVSYSRNGSMADHVLTYLRALKAEGLTVVLLLATDGLSEPLPRATDEIDGIIVRTNHGWDFAAWAAGLTILPDLWRARTLILANDSVYGPIDQENFRHILGAVRSSRADLVGLTDSYQVDRHLMSYFIGITSFGLMSAAVRNFWNGVRSFKDKMEVIRNYELTAIKEWQRRGVTYEVLFPTLDNIQPPPNPTLVGWRELLDRGFPFLKVQLLRDKLLQADPTGWEDKLEGNPSLRAAIQSHLSVVAHAPSRRSDPSRPIPAPRRRFRRKLALKTAYGATTSMRPTAATDLALEVPFGFAHEIAELPDRVAVIAHIFYPELCGELLEKFRNIPVQADLFLSTDTEEKKSIITDFFTAHQNGSVSVRVFPNVGRDVAPTFVGHADVFEQYEFFVHVHSKRSPHDGRFASWRDFLLDNLIGSPDIVRSVLRLLAEDDVGIVFSQHFPEVRHLLNWGYDYDTARELLGRAGVALRKDLVLEFPSSSFFWGRSAAIKRLLDLTLSWSDFPAETGQIDGTLAHAIERSILYFAEAAGFRWAKVAHSGTIPANTLVPVLKDRELHDCLMRVHRPLLGNRLHPNFDRKLFPEISRVATRRDSSRRPRLNLLLPTLHPKHIFGGITTALRTFEELASHLGTDFDLRIVCGMAKVDLNTMVAFPDYRLLYLGAPHDDFPRTIVDITDAEGGELPVRAKDIFVATAWWTAALAYDLQSAQRAYYGIENRLIYLIQDHEPGFYNWSPHFAQAQSTYHQPDKMIALINSEELANFMSRHYDFEDSYVVRYRPNPTIRRYLIARPRERIILFYGRPSTQRNCFQTICSALVRWQQAEPTIAEPWRIVSVGEDYGPRLAGPVNNLEVAGKLSLQAYADLLSRASVGISLMISPHPSYPPLEMAHAGLRTITNSYEFKDLTLRNPNFMSIDIVTPDNLAGVISQAVAMAEETLGEIVPFVEIADIGCDMAGYDPSAMGDRLRRMTANSPIDSSQ
ncbi:MAG: hypothetical protein NVS2B5_20460 [Beijerinckiaceae bacterium]